MTEEQKTLKEMTPEERVLKLTLVASTQAVILNDLSRLVIEFIDGNHLFRAFAKRKEADFAVISDDLRKLSEQLNEAIGLGNE